MQCLSNVSVLSVECWVEPALGPTPTAFIQCGEGPQSCTSYKCPGDSANDDSGPHFVKTSDLVIM